MCKAASPADLRSLIMFKSFLSRTYLHLITTIFDVDMTCTWSLIDLVHAIGISSNKTYAYCLCFTLYVLSHS